MIVLYIYLSCCYKRSMLDLCLAGMLHKRFTRQLYKMIAPPLLGVEGLSAMEGRSLKLGKR